MNEVLMDLVVTLAAAIDELAGVDDQYGRELLHVLESVAAELEKLSPDDRRAFAAHVEAMSGRAAADPLVSAESPVPRRVSNFVRSDREHALMRER